MNSLVVGIAALLLSVPAGGTFYDDDRLPGESAIEALVTAGVTSGCGPNSFCPHSAVTRGELVSFLGRALGVVTTGAAPPFSDVDESLFYAGYLASLHTNGIVSGYADGTFGGEMAVTRGELAVFLVRALDIEHVEPPVMFVDVPATAFYAAAVEAIRHAGITLGCAPDRYCPNSEVTRHDLALFLARAFDLPLPVVPTRTSPLDGLPAPDGFSVNRRIVAVKVDNAAPARPQSGIQHADAMIEVMVEGGLSRMMALFLESDTTYLGPVRSVRPTDSLIEALGATVAISGGQPWIADLLAIEGIPIIRESEVAPPALFRIPGRKAPHNLYADTQALRAEADRRGYDDAPPPALFRWGEGAYPTAPAARTIEISWSDPVSTIWQWDGQRYLRSSGTVPHLWVDEFGGTGRLVADNLVVIFGQYYEVAAPPGFGTQRVPAMDTIDAGRRMVLFTEGRVVEGTWSRATNDAWFTFFAADGTELVVPPGMTWIHVLPHDRPLNWD